MFTNPVDNEELNVILLDDFDRDDKVKISLIDALGRATYVQEVDHHHRLHHVIDCRPFPQGVYLIRVEGLRWQKASRVLIK